MMDLDLWDCLDGSRPLELCRWIFTFGIVLMDLDLWDYLDGSRPLELL